MSEYCRKISTQALTQVCKAPRNDAVYKEEPARGALGVVEIAVSLVMAVNKADRTHKLCFIRKY